MNALLGLHGLVERGALVEDGNDVVDVEAYMRIGFPGIKRLLMLGLLIAFDESLPGRAHD